MRPILPGVITRRYLATRLLQVSGKNWKGKSQRMSATGTPILRTSWEQKMVAKAEAAIFKEQKTEARAEHNSKLAVSRSQDADKLTFRMSNNSAPL